MYGRPRQGAIVGAAIIGLVVLAHDASGQAEQRVRTEDALIVTVAGQPELSRKYGVGPDGTVDLPLIGPVAVMNLTAEEVSAELERRFQVYLREPDVSVELERPRHVFVFGQVTNPGSYELTPDMTLLEALARAGYTGASQVFLVRTGGASGPVLPESNSGDVMTVNLRDLEHDIERGDLSRNVVLRDGDTIFVPYFDPNLVRVSGEVRSPGAYAVPEGTTVVQAVTLAGGATERAALGRSWVVRIVDGRARTLSADPEDSVRPGDTIVVPETVFPLFAVGDPDPDRRLPMQLRAGRTLVVTPAFALRQVGIDTNVFNTETDRTQDFVVVAGPQLDVVLNLDRVRLWGRGTTDFVYFLQSAGERSADHAYSAGADVAVTSRLMLSGARSDGRRRNRPNHEVDARVRHFERATSAGATLQVGERLSLAVEGRDREIEFHEGARFLDVDLRETLTERIRSVSATASYAVTPLSALVVSGTAGQHRFPFMPARDADATEYSFGAEFRPAAVLSGDGRVGYLRYLTRDPEAPDFEGMSHGANLYLRVTDRTLLGFGAERTTGNSFEPRFSYGLIDRYGMSIRRLLSRRLDVHLEGYHETFSRREFVRSQPALAAQGSSPARSEEETLRFTSSLGVRVSNGGRLSFDTTYVRRLSPDAGFRAYDGVRMGLGLTFGVLRVQGR